MPKQVQKAKPTKAAPKSKVIEKVEPKKMKLSKRFNKLKKLEKITGGHLKGRAIVYIGHLPKGFNEEQLKGFFTQFGEVTRFRVSRSPKTGRSRGFAYLEFSEKEVADVAVQTMHKYIMFGKQIECHIVDQPHKDTFKNGNRDWKFIPRQLVFRNNKNQPKSADDKKARVAGLLNKEKEKRDRLKELGISYDFAGYKELVKAAKKTFEG
jgi:nucleolar protein 15